VTWIPLAHAGHWFIDVAYVLPFAGLLIWLFVTTIRERRQQEREAAEKGPDG
jgi:hypothetical protein